MVKQSLYLKALLGLTQRELKLLILQHHKDALLEPS